MPNSKTYILAGFRAIQVLQYYGIQNFNKLYNILNELFGYDREVISNIIIEFTEYGFIKLRRSQVNTLKIIDLLNIELRKKINYVLDDITFDTILGDVAYLNMCAMRTLINEKMLSGD